MFNDYGANYERGKANCDGNKNIFQEVKNKISTIRNSKQEKNKKNVLDGIENIINTKTLHQFKENKHLDLDSEILTFDNIDKQSINTAKIEEKEKERINTKSFLSGSAFFSQKENEKDNNLKSYKKSGSHSILNMRAKTEKNKEQNITPINNFSKVSQKINQIKSYLNYTNEPQNNKSLLNKNKNLLSFLDGCFDEEETKNSNNYFENLCPAKKDDLITTTNKMRGKGEREREKERKKTSDFNSILNIKEKDDAMRANNVNISNLKSLFDKENEKEVKGGGKQVNEEIDDFERKLLKRNQKENQSLIENKMKNIRNLDGVDIDYEINKKINHLTQKNQEVDKASKEYLSKLKNEYDKSFLNRDSSVDRKSFSNNNSSSNNINNLKTESRLKTPTSNHSSKMMIDIKNNIEYNTRKGLGDYSTYNSSSNFNSYNSQGLLRNSSYSKEKAKIIINDIRTFKEFSTENNFSYNENIFLSKKETEKPKTMRELLSIIVDTDEKTKTKKNYDFSNEIEKIIERDNIIEKSKSQYNEFLSGFSTPKSETKENYKPQIKKTTEPKNEFSFFSTFTPRNNVIFQKNEGLRERTSMNLFKSTFETFKDKQKIKIKK